MRVGTPEKPTLNRESSPVRISQMPNNNIPRFLVSLMGRVLSVSQFEAGLTACCKPIHLGERQAWLNLNVTPRSVFTPRSVRMCNAGIEWP